MSLRRKVADAYLAKQGRYHPQPQQPQTDLNTIYLRQRALEPQRPRRHFAPPEKKSTLEVLREASEFLKK
jgi:hypothetical protein